MKRKIFSKLLMGAFLIASVSSFVSCKDYDDDINNLQKQIDAAALKAELTTLQTNLAAQIAAAQSAAQAAQAAAEKAQATANNAATKDALEAVKTLATAAGTDAAKAIADAANAQNTADVAKSAATAAQEAAAAAQNVANGASDKAATALADAAKALATAEAANTTANKASETASAADATAKEAKATADNAIAAAGNATTQAADAVKAAGEAKAAAEAAKYNDEAVKLLIAQAQASADAAAEDAKEAAEAAAAAVLASASATEDAATAKEAAAKAEETIKDAIANATKAIEEATDAKIKAAVAEAVAKIPTDQSEAVAEQAAAIETLKGNLQTLADAQGKLATAEGLAAAVEDLEGKLDATAEAAAIAAVAAAAGTIQEAFDALYSAVTSVELVASFTGWNIYADASAKTYPLGFTASTSTSIDLDFIFGKMAWTATFGDKETESLDDDAVEKVEYKEGDDIRAERALLIRVNPTNATFTKDQVKFINSKLETLDDIIEIGDPYRFKGMITRASQESGLWVIPVKVKKDVTFNQFNEKTFYKGPNATWGANDYAKADVAGSSTSYKLFKGDLNINSATIYNKLYAIAINNTTDPEDAEVSRYVASSYDVAALYTHYTPAYRLNADFEWSLDNADKYGATYTATGKQTIHNRWISWANWAEPTSGIRSKDQTNAYTVVPEAMEKRWTMWAAGSDELKAGLVAPTAAEPTKSIEKTVGAAKKYNTEDDGTDYRYGEDYLTVANTGDPIKIELTSTLKHQVEYWYISYDFELNAVESKPSEWEAWQSYKDEIEGIYTMTRGDQPITLQVNKKTAQGDVIGFRIWAVNYDGSLVDPDGKAFYIKIGEEPDYQGASATAAIQAVNKSTDIAFSYLKDKDAKYTADKEYNVSVITAVTGLDFKSLVGFNGWEEGTNCSTTFDDDFSGYTTVTSSGAGDTKIKNGTSVTIYWALLNSNKELTNNWKDVAFIKAGIDGSELANWRDDQNELTLGTLIGVRSDVNNPERYKLTIKVTKKMPDAAWTKKYHFDDKIQWKYDYDYNLANNTLTVFSKPYFDLVYTRNFLAPNYVKDRTPQDFYWKFESTAQNLSSWIDDTEWLNWNYGVNTNLANAGARNFNDYIASVDPLLDKSLYKFVIKSLPTGTKKGNVDYVTLWEGTNDENNATDGIFGVLPQVVRDGMTKTTELKYTYKGISLRFVEKKDGVTKWDGNDLDVPALTFNTAFRDAMDLLTYSTEVPYIIYDEWQKNPLGSDQLVGQKTMKEGMLFLAWRGNNGGTDYKAKAVDTDINAVLFQLALIDATAANVTGANDLLAAQIAAGIYTSKQEASKGFSNGANFNIWTSNLYGVNPWGAASGNLASFMQASITDGNKVLASNIFDVDYPKQMKGAGIGNPVTGAGFDFDPNYYSFDNPATEDKVENAMSIKLSGAITTYLKVSDNATVNNLVLQKIGGVNDPQTNIGGAIELSGCDVYGKLHTFKLPVTLIFNY